MPRRSIRAAAALALAAPAIALLPACSKNLIVTYPGNNPVSFPWKSCGQDCVAAFAQLEDTHDPAGKDCDTLVNHAADIQGGDDRVAAAALYDSALVLILRGDSAGAADRFARASALDSDPEYQQLAQLARDSSAKYPMPAVPSPILISPTAPPPSAASSAPGAAQPAQAPPPPPGPAPTSSALVTPR